MTGSLIGREINAPRIHQEIIARLIYGLSRLYYEHHTGLFPYPETMIDEGQTSPVPDIMLIDKGSDLTRVIIEITHTQGVKKDGIKLQTLLSDYEVPEGFVYDYKQDRWYHYQGATGVQTESAWCEVLGINLSELLHEDSGTQHPNTSAIP